MSKIYGSPLFLSGSGGANKDLPPLLDNFKAFEGGVVDDGLTRLKDLPNGTKVKFGTYNSQTLVWRIAQDEGVTKAVLDLDYDTGTTVIGNMVVSPANSICGNWAITGWLNATEAGGSWWANRVHYEDSEYPETEPTYSSQDGFLHGWSESDRGILQNIDWDCDDDHKTTSLYYLNSRLIIVSEEEAIMAWSGNSFAGTFTNSAISRTMEFAYTYYMETSGSRFTEGPTRSELSSSTFVIWPVCAPNPEAVVSDAPDDDGCYTIDYNKIAVTIQADKMLESRANELAGAVWVYADHEPESVNDGTKIQLSREEIVTDEIVPETITLADIPVSDAETETIVNLKETDGALHPYIYLVKGYEYSNGALLWRKDIAGQSAWTNQPSSYAYIGQALDTFIQTQYVNQLDESVKSVLINTSIQTNGTTAAAKAFALSVTELNITSGVGNHPTEGSAIPYFNSAQRRISTGYWWTRTHVSGTTQAVAINTSGNPENSTPTTSTGVRPAIVLPLNFQIKTTPNLDGSYDMYEETSTASAISTSETTESNYVTRTIQWDGTKDFFARQFTYNSKKQYQTMLEGSIATLNDVPEGQPITELESGSKVKLGVWNDTPLQWKVARDTVDQSLRLVLEPVSVALLGNMQYDAPEPSNSDSNRKGNGNNRYIYSNIHQWLNATKVSGWYTAQHSADASPAYASSPGFLSGWSETDLSALDEATLTTTKARVDGGGTETFVARAALISTTELGLQSDTGGGRLDIFNANGDRITGESYWTRTPHPSDSYRGCQVSATGSLYNIYSDVFYAVGVRPLCSPKSTTYVSLEPDGDGCYTITGVNE